MSTRTKYTRPFFSMIYIDQPRRTASDKILHDKAFKIASNLKYNGYKRGLAYMLYKVFD